MPSPEALFLYLACVVLASVLQNLTAFAFGLVLLGLVELLGILPLADVSNASMVLSLTNALAFIWRDREPLPWRQVKDVLWASIIGVVAGLGLQVWLSANAAVWLRLLLGLSVIFSAANLMFSGSVRTETSGRRSFAFFGALSGLLGGLFATSGPPIVYHMLRQPWDPAQIRRCLNLVFSVNNGLRLVLVVGSGRFSQQSALLCAIAVPVAFLVTITCMRFPIPIPRSRLLPLTALLLALTGASLTLSSARVLLAPLLPT
jgi:uncharacterized membrane protein YfcA